MMRRRLLALAFVATPLVAVAVACSFPDVTYAPTTTSPDTDADTDAHPGPDPGTDGSSDVAEASVGSSDSSTVDASSCNNSCDCDGDHYWRDSGCNLDASDAAGRLGFGDCNDFNKDYFPTQTTYFDVAKSGGFDYNCDGVETGLYPGSLACSGTGALGCSPKTGGYAARAPSCGQSGTLSTCAANGILACQPNAGGLTIEPCR